MIEDLIVVLLVCVGYVLGWFGGYYFKCLQTKTKRKEK